MRKFSASKLAFLAVLFLFASAFTWNMVHGAGAIVGGQILMAPDAVLLAHSPTFPPDPWDGVRLAHSPTFPPDPWDGVRLAHSPTFPPDPWDGVRLAHSPTFPPDPWDGVRIAA
jgi:hypothetical protein